MKKILVLCLAIGLCAGATLPAQAQEPPTDPIEVGTWMINAGIGGSNYYYGDGLWLFGFGFKAAVQKGLWQLGPGAISLGGELSMGSASYQGDNFFRFNIAPRGSYHYGWNVPGLDTYGGIAMGLGFLSDSGRSGNNTVVYGGLYVGGSYFFIENFAVNAEMSFLNFASLHVGFAYRF